MVMDLLNKRFTLANKTELIIALISLAIALFALFVSQKSDSMKIRVTICTLVIVISIGLCWNYIGMSQYAEVINVAGMTSANAKQTLAECGFDSNNIRSEYESGAISSNDATVDHVVITDPQGKIYAPDTKIANKASSFRLICIANEQISTPQDDNVENPDKDNVDESISVDIGTIDNEASNTNLSIIIDEVNFFSDGYYYEMPLNDGTKSIIDFDKGINGHFTYSRSLTSEEYENWYHGGKIIDAYGNECSSDAWFFSDYNGVFAMQLPADLPSGEYTYIFYQFINDIYCEAQIHFTIS